MPSPNNTTNITPPRVPLIDERTGLISREWYRFFLNLFTLTGGGANVTSLTDLQLGPPAPQQEDLVDIIIDVEATKIQPTEESANEQIAELAKQVEALSVLPLTSWVLSELAELQSQIDGLSATSVPPVSFLTNGSSILYGDNLGGFSNVAIGSGVSFSGGTLSATGSGGTVTAVTGTAPVVSSGGTTPAISMPKATGSVDGYLSSTDWTTFNNKQPAGTYVTSVGATAPITSTGGTTPTIGVTAAALTEVDDTNVTLTLGGSPSTALLAATSLTLGWTGQLATSRGGTGLSSFTANGVVYASSTSALATGSAFTFDGSGVVVSVNSASDGLRITQLGAGNALVVEDNTNPDATPFVIDATGRVIDGYTTTVNVLDPAGVSRTPQIQLHGLTTSTAGQSITNWSTAGTSYSVLYLSKSKSGTVGTQGVVASGDTIGDIQFSGDDGTNFVPAARIFAAVDGTPGTNDMPGRLVFSTTADGAATPTARMRIDSAGYSQQLTAPILPYQGAPTSKAAAATLSGAELVTGILNTTGLTYTITLPTGANIEGALSWAGNNVALDWWVVNTASGVITIGANGNTTLGLLTIAAGVSAHFRIRRTAANTFTVYRLS